MHVVQQSCQPLEGGRQLNRYRGPGVQIAGTVVRPSRARRDCYKTSGEKVGQNRTKSVQHLSKSVKSCQNRTKSADPLSRPRFLKNRQAHQVNSDTIGRNRHTPHTCLSRCDFQSVNVTPHGLSEIVQTTAKCRPDGAKSLRTGCGSEPRGRIREW